MFRPRGSDDRQPVVTGFGVVSAIGVGAEPFWQGVRCGRQAARPVQAFDTTHLRNRFGCEIDDALLPAPQDDRWSALPRASRLGAIAATEALLTAGLDAAEVEGLCVGTTMGDLPTVESHLADLALPESRALVQDTLGSAFGSRIADALGIPGPALTIATSCSAGNVAICRAADLIANGSRSALLAGGAEAFSRVAFIGFSRLRAMAAERCTPFATDRKGMLLGEGAAFLVIESLRSARQRGARVYAAIAGYGLSCDAYHVATPDPSGRGAAAAMQQALDHGGIAAADVDYVSAHGTGTQANDLAESRAYHAIFGESGSSEGALPMISSLKALVGHSLGAASALEAVASVLSLRDQQLIPAWNLAVADPECGVELPLPGTCDTPRRLDVVLSNAFAFGGNNSCLALRRLDSAPS
jgi:3-oxoacyl-[acyl-carrier-protein] synthase II